MPSREPVGLPIPTVAIAFVPEYLDFRRGIHVGNLEDNERITRILKLELESRYAKPFVTERYGRGVFWQWIGYLPRANREAKPASHRVSFGCSKFFISLDTDDKLFKCGMQVERGYLRAPSGWRHCQLAADWDWHHLVKGLRAGTPMERQLRRLVFQEGFRIFAGSWENKPGQFARSNFPAMTLLRRTLERAPANHWAGFQVYYAMTEDEVRATTGVDLVQAMVAVFREVTPAMNLCMQITL